MSKSFLSVPTHSAVVLILVFILSGCGTTSHDATFAQDFSPAGTAMVMVGDISDVAPKGNRGDQADFDTEKELRDQLEAKLSESGLLALEAADGEHYVLNAEIVDYDPGSAGKRWLLPGYGATELSVQCTLYEGGREVGKVFARRTVEAGGLYTVGAWKGVFGTVAEEIVKELRLKLGV